ncbi:DUF2586 family protein [Polyangium sp. y55x31]|uniref:DUF2586 family protein n=1 Tax=Polyangium sp. y55x31 TaxID=3042688 RepID=UPI00248258C0|nr:DUF2586 family protein [Polyangium sp. y55x31]MDI1484816.1 DUF2586 family protein [Polyangium sp. y55x31]
MPSAEITFTEYGPAGEPASAARVVAKVGICSAGSKNTVYAFDVPSPVAKALGEGPLTEATAQAVRVSKQRTLAVPIEASISGVLGPVTQSGPGPAILLSGAPTDTASVRVRITKSGPQGVGRFRVSISGTAAGAQVVPRFGTELVIPTRKAAEVTGTRDLSRLAYAKPAEVRGDKDLGASGLYGPAGLLDGKTIEAKINGAEVSCVLEAPKDGAALLSQLSNAFSACVFSLGVGARLVWTSKAIGKAATIELLGGSALGALGLVVGLKQGEAGDLDGTTLDMQEDAGEAQTVEFKDPPADPAAVLAVLGKVNNVAASLVAPASKLRLASKTIGEGSRLVILGGSALELLGLPKTDVKGREADHKIPGVGVTIQFPAAAFVKDTEYAFACHAPGFSIEAVIEAIDKLVHVKADFRILHVVGELADAAETRALAEALDTKIAELEALKRPIVAIIGAPLTETDEALAAAFEGFVSRRVSVCARGAWLRGGTLPGSFLRSQSWAAAYKAAAVRFSSDLGNHDDGPLKEVDALPVDEGLATVKLRAARFTVMDTSGGNAYFARGLTMADERSRYRDLNVTRVMIEAYLAAQPILDNEINNDPPLNEDGTLETNTAGAIDRAVTNALASALMPDHASAVRARVIRTDNIFETNFLRATMTVVPRGQIYGVSAELGPGLLTDNEEEGG